jgi:hypothetical protein
MARLDEIKRNESDIESEEESVDLTQEEKNRPSYISRDKKTTNEIKSKSMDTSGPDLTSELEESGSCVSHDHLAYRQMRA